MANIYRTTLRSNCLIDECELGYARLDARVRLPPEFERNLIGSERFSNSRHRGEIERYLEIVTKVTNWIRGNWNPLSIRIEISLAGSWNCINNEVQQERYLRRNLNWRTNILSCTNNARRKFSGRERRAYLGYIQQITDLILEIPRTRSRGKYESESGEWNKLPNFRRRFVEILFPAISRPKVFDWVTAEQWSARMYIRMYIGTLRFSKGLSFFLSSLHFFLCLSFFAFHRFASPLFASLSRFYLSLSFDFVLRSFSLFSLSFFYFLFSISFLLSPPFPTTKTHRAHAPCRLSFTNISPRLWPSDREKASIMTPTSQRYQTE